MTTNHYLIAAGAFLLASPCMAIEIAKQDTATLEFGGWIATEYSHNFDDSPYDLGFNSNASRLFFAGENKINDDITVLGKLEYAVAFSDITDTEFNTRLGYIGVRTPYGSIEAGKVWSPFYDIAMYSDTVFSNKDTATGAFYAPASEVGGFGRADNSVKYYNQLGVGDGKILVGLIVGDQNDQSITDSVKVNTTYGGSLRYVQGGFQFGVAHQVAKVDGLSNGDDTINATIVGAFYNSEKWMFGGNYTFGKNNQNEFGATQQKGSKLVDSDGIEFYGHYRFSDSWKVFVGYNSLTTETDTYTTEFSNVGVVKNFDQKLALYSEYRIDHDSTKNSLFYGDAWSFGIVYFFSGYPQYF
ncbi:porin [Vibrio parahaemolyticus]|nr:porin [Vibrio parahaemolyticus]EIA1769779.1 porin [Vibrio parahaemolyticus]EJG1086807.1 porin [Vibrio parahaemolyticus]EJS4017138.1 porin [Vibrio parahaemolyticus]